MKELQDKQKAEKRRFKLPSIGGGKKKKKSPPKPTLGQFQNRNTKEAVKPKKKSFYEDFRAGNLPPIGSYEFNNNLPMGWDKEPEPEKVEAEVVEEEEEEEEMTTEVEASRARLSIPKVGHTVQVQLHVAPGFTALGLSAFSA